MEALKRDHEVYVDEFFKCKLDENQNVINNLMNRVRELQYEINCVHDSRDFKMSRLLFNTVLLWPSRLFSLFQVVLDSVKLLTFLRLSLVVHVVQLDAGSFRSS